MEFTVQNVNKVLDEVRPHLISDGGNVAVHKIDPEKRSVELVLEGACGSCPSSTVRPPKRILLSYLMYLILFALGNVA